jgi:hypothetical protein
MSNVRQDMETPWLGDAFAFRGETVGFFTPYAPKTSGVHAYESTSGPGHFKMHSALAGAGQAICTLEAMSPTVEFTVVGAPVRGFLSTPFRRG